MLEITVVIVIGDIPATSYGGSKGTKKNYCSLRGPCYIANMSAVLMFLLSYLLTGVSRRRGDYALVLGWVDGGRTRKMGGTPVNIQILSQVFTRILKLVLI